MMNALLKKLNFKNQAQLLLVNMPLDLENLIIEFSKDVKITNDFKTANNIEFTLIFVTTFKDVETYIKQLHKNLTDTALLWFCFPKQSSKKHKSEVNRDNAWQVLGNLNYEPVRAVAIDSDWTALRFKQVDKIKTLKRNFAISEKGKERIKK